MIIENNKILKILLEADDDVNDLEKQPNEKPSNTKGFEEDPMGFIISKYHGLSRTLVELMSPDFKQYLSAIFVVAPKPTTFKIILHNGQFFFITYMGKGFYEANIAGKRYYMNNIGTKERAMEAIARLLKFGSPLKTKGPEGAEQGTRPEEETGGNEQGQETGAEEPNTEEPGEALKESMNIKNRLKFKKINQDLINVLVKEVSLQPKLNSKVMNQQKLLEALSSMIVLQESTEDTILSVLKSNKDIDAYEPIKVVKSGGNNYKVYFKGINTKDVDLRKSVLTYLSKLKGLRTKISTKPATWSSIGYVEVDSPKFGKINLSVKGTSTTATSTNVKEGLVLSFYYSKLKGQISPENFKSSIQTLISATVLSDQIEDRLKKEIVAYLQSLENNKANIEVLNQPMSQALAIKKAYPKGELIRSGLFTEYRRLAQQKLRIPADKWCPGDVYLLTSQAKAAVKILNLANEQDNPASSIEILNNAFAEEWGATNRPLVAISLKFEQAQGGKAKAYFEKFKKAKHEYNLTDDEIDYDTQTYQKAITSARKKLQTSLKGIQDINYKLDSGKLKDDLNFLRAKYAALKAINFFFSQLPKDQIDDGLVALAAFGMSLSDTSPAFFKVTANSKGGPGKIDTHERGASLALFENGDHVEPIDIIDNPTFGGLEIKMIVSKGGKPYSVKIVARSNGFVQGTIELQKVKAVEE